LKDNLKKQLCVVKQTIEDMRLPYLRISLTAKCNAKCEFCHNEGQKTGGSSNQVNHQEITAMADYFKDVFNRVVFTGGEPLLSLELLCDYIKPFKKFGYNVGLTTNGILLSEEYQKTLHDVGLDTINISMNSLEKTKYESFYSVDGLGSILKNFETLTKYFPSPQSIKINFIVTKATNLNSEIQKFSSLSIQKGFIISIIYDINEKNSLEITNRIQEKLSEIYGTPRKKTMEEYKRRKYYLSYKSGAVWEFDDYRTGETSLSLKDNKICNKCPKEYKDKCREGAYALRLYLDGTLRPCLGRDDNLLKLIKER
jgi:cyclic pyranopterin phosphate synthase